MPARPTRFITSKYSWCRDHGLKISQPAVAHTDLTGVTADQHHTQAHAVGGADHTGSLTDALHGTLAGNHPTGGEKTWLTNGLAGNVAFPAVQLAAADGNTLDDYEEGSWTPGVAFGGLSVGVTYGFQVGRYVKIGSLVHAFGRLQLTSKGTSVGSLTITGLPFTSLNVANAFNSGSARLDNVTFANVYMLNLAANDTAVALMETTEAAGAVTNLANTNAVNTSECVLTVVYRV